jgi:IS5 family transposase
MCSKQLGFSDYKQSIAKKRTRQEIFLSDMDTVVPWQALIDLIDPHYPRPAIRVVGPPIHW